MCSPVCQCQCQLSCAARPEQQQACRQRQSQWPVAAHSAVRVVNCDRHVGGSDGRRNSLSSSCFAAYNRQSVWVQQTEGRGPPAVADAVGCSR